MIDERREEQASLYVLGSLDAQATREFEAMLQRDPELQQLVATLRAATDALAGNTPLISPPSSLRQKILDQVESQEKIVPLPLPTRTGAVSWFPWALAACLAVACGLIALHEANQAGQFNTRLAQLAATVSDLETETNNLHQAVSELTRKNQLANLRIAVLDSQVPDSKAVAVTLWDGDRQNGMLVVQNLADLPADKDYQLWVIDPDSANPIDAGVFGVDADGNARIAFTAKSRVKTANKFAVTIERKGGVPKAEGKAVLVGS